MRVSIIGAGYVGLVSGACLAEKGHRVTYVDVDQEKVDKINAGTPPIYEQGLGELLEKNIHDRLSASTDLHKAVLETDLSIIAVGTPFNNDAIDLRAVKEVSYQIAQALREKASYHVVVVKSTVVPGTTCDVVRPILERVSGKKVGPDFGVGMNPEFLREGEAVEDFMHPDRIVLGGIDTRSVQALEQLYAVFNGVERITTTPDTAEMIKYTANSLLATLISFSNEMGNLCSSLGGIDIVEVMRGVHLDKRISPVLASGERVVPSVTTYLEAGCGFGGSCFKKDVKALIAHGRHAGLPMRLLDSVIEVNERQPSQVLSLLRNHFPSLKGTRIAILGLAFKPDTADMRESPAIPIVRQLMEEEARIKTYDPLAKEEALRLFGNHEIVHCDELSRTLEDAQVVVLLTRWSEFESLPRLLESMDPQPLFIDGRRMLDKHSIARYDGIGLGRNGTHGDNGAPGGNGNFGGNGALTGKKACGGNGIQSGSAGNEVRGGNGIQSGSAGNGAT